MELQYEKQKLSKNSSILNKFILAITTYNRIAYLKDCISSFNNTRSNAYSWTLIIADDGSTDGTLEYLEQLSLENCTIEIIKNNRIGVHQQMNTILQKLETTSFDFCFKIDDDITFLQSGWDDLYFETAIKTGVQHLVFCDENWNKAGQLTISITNKDLIGRVSLLQAQGFFYTITPEILNKVGYMDVESFGFRGMGHVDFTARCAKAGFTDRETPWDIINSNEYITASKEAYKSVLPSTAISAYDEFTREKKESIIRDPNRIFISLAEIDHSIYNSFQKDLILALSNKVENSESEKQKEVNWYKEEINKINNWYENQYNHLPKWFVKVGKVFKLL